MRLVLTIAAALGALLHAQSPAGVIQQSPAGLTLARQRLRDGLVPQAEAALFPPGGLPPLAAPALAASLRAALENTESALGPDHPLCGLLRSRYAESLEALGELASARILQARAAILFEEALGAGHPAALLARLRLARSGEGAPAPPDSLPAPSDPLTRGRLFLAAAEAHFARANTAQTERALAEALLNLERAGGPAHPEYAAALIVRARHHASLGQWSQTEAAASHATAIWDRAFPAEPAPAALALIAWSQAAHALGRHADASALLQRATNALRAHAPASAAMAEALDRAGWHALPSDPGAAQTSFRAAAAIESALPLPHAPLAQARRAAALTAARGEFDPARKSWQAFLDSALRSLPATHPWIAHAQASLGEIEIALGDARAATSHLSAALGAFETSGREDLERARLSRLLAQSLSAQGRSQEAIGWLRRAFALLQKLNVTRGPLWDSTRDSLATLLRNAGLAAEAAALPR